MKRMISFRQAMALLYLSSVIPLLILVGILVYFEYRTFLIIEHRTSLTSLLNVLATPPHSSLAATSNLITTQLLNTDFQAHVLTADGTPLDRSQAPLLNAADYAAMRNGMPFIRREVWRDGELLQVYAIALRNETDQIIGFVEGFFPVSVINPDLNQLNRWLIIIISGTILLTIIITPFIASLSIRPLTNLFQTVHSIAQGNFSIRARPSSVKEVHELAFVVNTMLDRIQEMLAAEQRTAQGLRQFAADASHELRTPLAVIGNGLEVLAMAMRRQDTAHIQQLLPRLQREYETMRRLVDNLLLLARMDQPDAAVNSLHVSAIAPLPLLEEAAERAQTLAQGQHVHFTWTPPLPDSIIADADALQRALNNLVDNALRHTPAGRSITLQLTATANECRFTVADEGEGIAPEFISRLGERFFRPHAKRDRQSGCGLGLAIVKAIARSHGGRLELSSAPGKGFTATLVLPITPAPSVTQPRQYALPLPTPMKTTQQGALTRRPMALIALISGIITLGGAASLISAFQTAPHNTSIAAPARPTVTLPAPASAYSPLAGQINEAIQIASQDSNLSAISVKPKSETERLIIEIELSDGSRVEVDPVQHRIITFRPAPAGNGRGIERQRLERARVALALSQQRVVGFDEIAGRVQDFESIALILHDDRLYYEVEYKGKYKLLFEATTGQQAAP